MWNAFQQFFVLTLVPILSSEHNVNYDLYYAPSWLSAHIRLEFLKYPVLLIIGYVFVDQKSGPLYFFLLKNLKRFPITTDINKTTYMNKK
jgi:hypothetical protein